MGLCTEVGLWSQFHIWFRGDSKKPLGQGEGGIFFPDETYKRSWGTHSSSSNPSKNRVVQSRCFALCRIMWQCVEVYCSVLQCAVVYCSVLQCHLHNESLHQWSIQSKLWPEILNSWINQIKPRKAHCHKNCAVFWKRDISGVSEKAGESRREHFHFFLAIFQQSDAHKVYESDSSTETESN